MKAKRKRWRWLIVAAVIVLAIIALIFWNQSRNASSRYQEESVRTGSIETYYSFSGSVAVRDSQSINAQTNATVREIYVRQDQLVQADEPLLRLSSGDIIKADIAGEVTEIHVSQGDTVAMGTPLVDIVDFENLQAVFKVDEFDVGAVTAGKEASVTIDALAWTYQETVEHIAKQALTSGGGMSGGGLVSASSGSDVTYYEAKIAVPLDERILPGMKVDVRILNERADNTLLLSMDALRFDAYNKPYVLMRASNGDVVQVSVTVGIQDGATVQILDGLRSGDTVLIQQSTSMFPLMGQMR